MKPSKLFLQSLPVVMLLFGCTHSARKENANYLAEPAPISPQKIEAQAGDDLEAGTYSFNVHDATGNTQSGYFKVEEIISSSAAVQNKNDTTRKFIRTADMKFRVKDVAKATYALEDIAAQFDGFVTYTNLSSNITRQTVTPVSADSSLETIYYVVQNTMTLRVPNTKLDSTLKAFVPVIDYLDHRIIKADDVQFQLLENKLKRERVAKYEDRMTKAVDDKGKKLQETTHAEDKILSKQEQADEALLATLRLKDKIAFSTIQLHIYQREVFRRELIANDKNIEAYHPGFFAKVLEALHFGWKMLEGILIFLAKSWGVILFAFALILGARYLYFRRN